MKRKNKQYPRIIIKLVAGDYLPRGTHGVRIFEKNVRNRLRWDFSLKIIYVVIRGLQMWYAIICIDGCRRNIDVFPANIHLIIRGTFEVCIEFASEDMTPRVRNMNKVVPFQRLEVRHDGVILKYRTLSNDVCVFISLKSSLDFRRYKISIAVRLRFLDHCLPLDFLEVDAIEVCVHRETNQPRRG